MSDDFSIPDPLTPDAPCALTCMALIESLSKAYQGVIDVKKPTGQVRPVSLNMLVVAEPGQHKTNVNSLLIKAKTKENSR